MRGGKVGRRKEEEERRKGGKKERRREVPGRMDNKYSRMEESLFLREVWTASNKMVFP